MPLETTHTTDLTNPGQTKQLLAETAVAALETMAFFCCDPAQPDSPWPEDALQVRMSFKGHVSGTVTLLAGRFFGQRLASNALGVGVEDEEAVSRAEDSLKELMNVVVGMMMPRLARSEADVFDLSLPTAEPFDAAWGWNEVAARPDACAIDAEGDTLVFCVNLTAD
jgi:hypothetical protein